MEHIRWTAGGRTISVSLPPTTAQWAYKGVRGVLPVPATRQGRGPEPRPLPEPRQENPALNGSAAAAGF
ncbi:hypothetical protein [Streptomyces sp. NBC_00347]|uniref:hypothetical protein n=1 Tax=Streptomyces sp. NBC_00347 TaxID=2975721 RepID=UPI002256ED08|nr:hypothetical protein [Streptomyces sp. NBC_00347]MCX5129245.1 hypothetical protein [Streptomyces sp. NBC_00347]